MVTTSSYSVFLSDDLFLFCSYLKLSHAEPKLVSCIMAANTYIILISVPGEKSHFFFFMKRMISFMTLAIIHFCDLLHNNFLVDFVSKGACVMVTFVILYSLF